ncbi:MAG: signal peptidase I [Rubrobacter sp.]|nr:signal peptidase I [Rubrobacter sp.]
MSRRARRQKRIRKRRRRVLTELFVIVFAAFVLVFGLVRPFVFESFQIPTESMVPTLEVGDRVLANKFVYSFTKPGRDDILVFRGLGGEEETLIKRVVGVAGDEILVQDGVLFVNGDPQKEPYLNKEFPSRDSYGPVTVPEGHVFLMGDNRGNSRDSRVFGPVPLENLEGKAFFRFWPVSKVGFL